jgi:hypothetical protein
MTLTLKASMVDRLERERGDRGRESESEREGGKEKGERR